MLGHVKYVMDEKGKRQEVILPFQVWKDVTAELEALREKHQILTGLHQSCRDVKRQKKGEVREQSLEGFLNELQNHSNGNVQNSGENFSTKRAIPAVGYMSCH